MLSRGRLIFEGWDPTWTQWACMYVRMYVCTYVRMYVCTHVRMYVCTYLHMYVCVYVRMYVCTYVRMYVCTYVRMYVCTYVHMYACTYVRMYVCVYVCRYVGMHGNGNGMVWYGMVWYGMVWYGMVWYVCMYVCPWISRAGNPYRCRDSPAPEESSEIIVDFSGILQWIFSGIFRHIFNCQWYVPKDCHFPSGFSWKTTNAFSVVFPNELTLLRGLVCNILPWLIS